MSELEDSVGEYWAYDMPNGFTYVGRYEIRDYVAGRSLELHNTACFKTLPHINSEGRVVDIVKEYIEMYRKVVKDESMTLGGYVTNRFGERVFKWYLGRNILDD